MKIFNARGLKFLLPIIFFHYCTTAKAAPISNKSIYISFATNAHPRESFGIEKLTKALKKYGYRVLIVKKGETTFHPNTFFIGRLQDEYIQNAMSLLNMVNDTTV